MWAALKVEQKGRESAVKMAAPLAVYLAQWLVVSSAYLKAAQLVRHSAEQTVVSTETNSAERKAAPKATRRADRWAAELVEHWAAR